VRRRNENFGERIKLFQGMAYLQDFCSEPGKLDRFWLEFSAVIPRLRGAESDEGLEVAQKAFI
jgi:hypothetical protein